MQTSQLPSTPPKITSGHELIEDIREKAVLLCKDFKISWVSLGQVLYAIYDDKMFHRWGYEKFENYTQKELGMPKGAALKLLKSYLFLEEEIGRAHV